jgi:hypothetical protein
MYYHPQHNASDFRITLDPDLLEELRQGTDT